MYVPKYIQDSVIMYNVTYDNFSQTGKTRGRKKKEGKNFFFFKSLRALNVKVMAEMKMNPMMERGWRKREKLIINL